MFETFYLEHAAERLRQQNDVVRHIRVQAAVIASFSVLVGRFWGPGASVDNFVFAGVMDYVAALLFVSSVVFALGAFLMSRSWQFSINTPQFEYLTSLDHEEKLARKDITDIIVRLMHEMAAENELKLARINAFLGIAAIAASLQLFAWIL